MTVVVGMTKDYAFEGWFMNGEHVEKQYEYDEERVNFVCELVTLACNLRARRDG